MEKTSPKSDAKPVLSHENSALPLMLYDHQASQPIAVTDNGEGPVSDVEMADVYGQEGSDGSTMYSDYGENLSHSSDYDSDPGRVDGPWEPDDRVFTNQINMGEIIEFAYRRDMDYGDDEIHNLSEDGLTGEEDSVNGSDTSTNYEELTGVDVHTIEMVVPVPLEEDAVVADEESSEGDDTYNDDDDDDDMEGDEVSDSGADVIVPDEELAAGLQDVEASPGSLTIDQLRHEDIMMQRLNKERDLAIWRVHEVQEAIRRLEAELPIAQNRLVDAENALSNKEKWMADSLEKSGLTSELYSLYKTFCESLQPEVGLRDGFSISCNQPHEGSYPLYDPEFAIFKREVEIDYSSYNWRCEAAVEKYVHSTDQVVEFWPLKPPEALASGNQLWGRLYPDLYRLLNEAVRLGSEAAKDILVRIPDMNASSAGGWMFDYEFEPLLKDELVISHRWVLRGSHALGPI